MNSDFDQQAWLNLKKTMTMNSRIVRVRAHMGNEWIRKLFNGIVKCAVVVSYQMLIDF